MIATVDERDREEQLDLAMRRDLGQSAHEALHRVEAALGGKVTLRLSTRSRGPLEAGTARFRRYCCSRSAPSSVVTERSRAECPIRPIRQATPGELAQTAADLDPVLREEHLAQHRPRRPRPEAGST